MSLLVVDHLKKSFGDATVVDGVSFAVAEGEVFGLLGPNGAGKTTTMMMVCGLLPSDSGSVTLLGEPYTGKTRERRMLLGVVPQELAVYPDLTGLGNLQFFGRLYGLKGEELASRCESALDRVGLLDQTKKKVANYSGGMKRRLNFAAALLHQPRLLILDEPTVGVDPQSRSHLLDCVRDLANEGVGIIYVSHYMEEVQAICERVGIMDHGQMLACDTLPNLLERLSARLEMSLSPMSEEQESRFKASLPPEAVVVRDLDVIRLHLDASRGSDDRAIADLLKALLHAADTADAQVLSLRTTEPNLEALFLELTGRRLRD